MRSDIVPGAIFPDYELSDHTGKHRTLSELQASDPMIVVLSRGGYCPKDRRQSEPRHDGLADAFRQGALAGQHVISRHGPAFAIDAEAGRGIALRVEIHHQCALPSVRPSVLANT